MRAVRFFTCTLILMLCVSAVTLAQKKALQPGEIILTGKLTRVMGVGGETTGWQLELQSDVTLEGQTMRSIEVAGPAKRLARLADQEVKARGFVKHHHGVERKDWLVLELTSIRIKSPTGTA